MLAPPSYSTRNRVIDDRESRTSTSRVDTERVIRVHTCSIIDRSIAYRESSIYILYYTMLYYNNIIILITVDTEHVIGVRT